MATVEERRKAKEAYLMSLQQQRPSISENTNNNNSNHQVQTVSDSYPYPISNNSQLDYGYSSFPPSGPPVTSNTDPWGQKNNNNDIYMNHTSPPGIYNNAISYSHNQTIDSMARHQNHQPHESHNGSASPHFGNNALQSNNEYHHGLNSLGHHGDNKEDKRIRQQQYAKELEEQMKFTSNNHLDFDHSSNGGFVLGSSDDKLLKKAKQIEYAKALNDDQLNGRGNFPHSDGSIPRDYNEKKGFEFGSADDKALKKAKQLEYAKALQDDQRYASQDHKRTLPTTINNDSEDWMIGPLGLPVRKPKQNTSPGKLRSPIIPSHFGGYYDANPRYPGVNEYEPTTGRELEILDKKVGNTLEIDSQEERDRKARQQKLEHQRALELQLQEQKAKKEREAAEALLQERLEEQRIEQERIRLQRIYEDELASRKNAAVNHQNQIEDRPIDVQSNQAAKLQQQRELEAMEEERFRREREKIAQKEMEEVARERAIQAMKIKSIPQQQSTDTPMSYSTPRDSRHSPRSEASSSRQSERNRIGRINSISVPVPEEDESIIKSRVSSVSSRRSTSRRRGPRIRIDSSPSESQKEVSTEGLISPLSTPSISSPQPSSSRHSRRPTNESSAKRINEENPEILLKIQYAAERARIEAANARQEIEELRKVVEELKVSHEERSDPIQYEIPLLDLPTTSSSNSNVSTARSNVERKKIDHLKPLYQFQDILNGNRLNTAGLESTRKRFHEFDPIRKHSISDVFEVVNRKLQGNLTCPTPDTNNRVYAKANFHSPIKNLHESIQSAKYSPSATPNLDSIRQTESDFYRINTADLTTRYY